MSDRVFRFAIGGVDLWLEASKSTGIGGHLWASAMITTGALLRSRASFEGKRVLELGSGTGALGIALATLGAHVTLTDTASHLPLLQRNVELNAARIAERRGSVTVRELDWDLDTPSELVGAFDLVVASDVVTLIFGFEGIQKQLINLCTPSTEVWLGYEQRGEEKAFWRAIRRHFRLRKLCESELHAEQLPQLPHLNAVLRLHKREHPVEL
ncbi:MAG: hypothetical protein MHM6MM_008095 [Cercozoa sp. M6MM]